MAGYSDLWRSSIVVAVVVSYTWAQTLCDVVQGGEAVQFIGEQVSRPRLVRRVGYGGKANSTWIKIGMG